MGALGHAGFGVGAALMILAFMGMIRVVILFTLAVGLFL